LEVKSKLIFFPKNSVSYSFIYTLVVIEMTQEISLKSETHFPELMTADELFEISDGSYRYELVKGELRKMPPAG